MCHDLHFPRERLRDEIAEELEEEPADDPDFLNEARDADVELLTDGGT